MSDSEKQVTIFHFEDDRPKFDDFSIKNGETWWWASDLAEWLGYASV